MPTIEDTNKPTNRPIAEQFRAIIGDGPRHARAHGLAGGGPGQKSSRTTHHRVCNAGTLLGG